MHTYQNINISFLISQLLSINYIATLLFHPKDEFWCLRVELIAFLMPLCADRTYRHVLPHRVRPHGAGPGHRVLSSQRQHHRQRLWGLQRHGRCFCTVTAEVKEYLSLVLFYRHVFFSNVCKSSTFVSSVNRFGRSRTAGWPPPSQIPWSSWKVTPNVWASSAGTPLPTTCCWVQVTQPHEPGDLPLELHLHDLQPVQ